ncbi:MAG TPA: tyrosine-protein phosphatase [Planctomycetota bacterium]|nr:tyrosine-protein phosphatase [Planctomycetota bacterium]
MSEQALAAPNIERSRSSVPRRRRWPKRVLIGGAAFSGLVLVLLWQVGLLGNNFREVSPGKCYRSAQLQADGFKDAIEKRGLKSVVNLRGERKNEAWYQGELAACLAEKVAHVDINIGLGELPHPEALKALVETLDAGPYPMLLHCRSGSDRSGLGAVFYRHLVEHKPLDEAEREQINWRYGHLAVGKAKSIDDFFKLYHESAGGQSLRDWIYKTYPAIYAKQAAAKTGDRSED